MRSGRSTFWRRRSARAPCPPKQIRAFDLLRRARVTALDVTAAGNGVDARRSGAAPASRAPGSRSRALLGGKIYITRDYSRAALRALRSQAPSAAARP
ncbi:MAG: hypothetical protein Kow0073_20150 [Immundisolibacter sp.]